MHTLNVPLNALPFLTKEIPGIGGRIRITPEDFRVEEQPLYLPCGRGEHLYLRITKRNLSTPDLVARLSSIWGVKARCIGVAGRKDARSIATQMVSVRGIEPEVATRLPIDDRILAVEVLGRHRNRLRIGHHAGNRFQIVIRDVHPSAASIVPLILEQLTKRGVPNFFGPQRQGREGQNYAIGASLLKDQTRRARMPKAKRLWYLHAYQSFLFNQILVRRIGRIDTLLNGDWAMKHVNGACFLVEDAVAEEPRVRTFEISPTGLLFGSRAPWASGEPGELERAAAEELGATPESLGHAAAACGFRGERRALRVPLLDLDWSLASGTMTLSFLLPPGAYATSVLRELMKRELLRRIP